MAVAIPATRRAARALPTFAAEDSASTMSVSVSSIFESSLEQALSLQLPPMQEDQSPLMPFWQQFPPRPKGKKLQHINTFRKLRNTKQWQMTPTPFYRVIPNLQLGLVAPVWSHLPPKQDGMLRPVCLQPPPRQLALLGQSV